jgi:hypothetical protein
MELKRLKELAEEGLGIEAQIAPLAQRLAIIKGEIEVIRSGGNGVGTVKSEVTTPAAKLADLTAVQFDEVRVTLPKDGRDPAAMKRTDTELAQQVLFVCQKPASMAKLSTTVRCNPPRLEPVVKTLLLKKVLKRCKGTGRGSNGKTHYIAAC